MTSYISNSESLKTGYGRMVALYASTALLIAIGLAAIEVVARHLRADSVAAPESVAGLMQVMLEMRISGREIGNQMLVHNVALFSRHPLPAAVSSGYVGTSRSKVLRPGHFGIGQAVVGAGNTYNEVTYGLLAQAEVLRLEFPNLKTVYVEASFLLRRPSRLIVEDDHRKYLPIIRSFEPLCQKIPDNEACRNIFKEVAAVAGNDDAKPAIQPTTMSDRSRIRFSTLFGGGSATKNAEGVPVLEDQWFDTVNYNGERKDTPQRTTAVENQRPKLANDNIKVQRMREIAANKPWDGLYDMFAVWGKEHGIQVVFFQPPVRSDLYEFQVKYGLSEHVADIRRVSEAYKIPFIDLNRSELGYTDDWSLYSDEDHMDTCLGSGLLTLAISDGYADFKSSGRLDPLLPRDMVEDREAKRLSLCQG